MLVQNFIAKVLHKAAPMEASEFNDLRNEMDVWFDKQFKAVRDKEKDPENIQPLTLKDKVFKAMNQWYVRAVFAALYVFVIRWVQDYINPAEPEYDDLPQQQGR